ncbi:hypothetical protein MML48_6g00005541 [Holotrichia oblita]|uniref:Uncharacterized protein n=1 Tax=Holotrichia oblita TaxID=644536 RepID=A0ACB9SXI8_HOLOL|nr:hypothetical protein MML48_6g00005541 [Holotrichia oblita]
MYTKNDFFSHLLAMHLFIQYTTFKTLNFVALVKDLQKLCDGKVINLEQYDRHNNLRMFGVQESDGENIEEIVTDILKSKLGINITSDFFERCHRVGKEINRRKNELKGSSIFLNDDLTQSRLVKFKNLQEEHCRKNVLNSSHYDILGLSETWLSGGIGEVISGLGEFRLIRSGRLGRGGGVGRLVRNNTEFTVLPIESCAFIEQLWIDITYNNFHLCVGVMYRVPNTCVSGFLNAFNVTLMEVGMMCDGLLCVGDCNIDLLVNNNNTLNFNAILRSFDLRQVVDEPTRITRDSSTLLDVVIISNGLNLVQHRITQYNLSDHCCIECDIDFFREPVFRPVRVFRNFGQFDYDVFIVHLMNTPWYNVHLFNSIDDKVALLNDYMTALFDVQAPVTRKSFSRPAAPWLTENVKLMMSLRDKPFEKFRKTRLPSHWDEYKSLRNFTTSAVKREKKAYLEHRLTTSNRKGLWLDLRDMNIYNKKTIKIPDNLLDADTLNEHFVSFSNIDSEGDQETRNFYNINKRPGVGIFSFCETF